MGEKVEGATGLTCMRLGLEMEISYEYGYDYEVVSTLSERCFGGCINGSGNEWPQQTSLKAYDQIFLPVINVFIVCQLKRLRKGARK